MKEYERSIEPMEKELC